jgi:hypothetical protein
MTTTRIDFHPRSGPYWPRLVVLLGMMLAAALTGCRLTSCGESPIRR